MMLDKVVSKKCNNAILISGCARSGTTILGKILHSFDGVEYTFEPPALFPLFAIIGKLKPNDWKLLYETYLYEEFFVNSLAGRAFNFNPHDDTYIFKTKSKDFVASRLAKTLRKKDAQRLASISNIAYKMPDIINFIPALKKYYPGTKVVIVTRKAPGVINSTLKKDWLSEESLRKKNEIWPKIFYKKTPIPYWVKKNDFDKWQSMDELHRAAYYYVEMNKGIDKIPGCIKIKYGDLLSNPEKTVRSVTKKLDLKWGEKTKKILATVDKSKEDADWDPVLDNLKPELKKQVRYYSRLS